MEKKVSISDPTHTILDFLISPKIGGGIRGVCQWSCRL